jgi:threonine/homoserine/homoserine lactone efflux protein
LGAAVATEIPIAMIVLSRVLKHGANRWANIAAGVITIAYVIGGGSLNQIHYIFFAAMEVACALLIVWYAWKWRSPATSTIPTVAVGVER